MATSLTNKPFVYDRKYPPLFFVKPTPHQKLIWDKSMLDTTKEYYSKLKDPHSKHDMPLSNGASLGEYSMHVITSTHNKRSING
jgi:hypothetical protein